MIREDRELLAELARLNTDMASLGLRVVEGSASAAEQRHYAERLIAVGKRLQRRADGMGGAVIEGEAVTATVLMLLRQHHVNKRGQCRFCGWTTWKWRFWRGRRRCTVYATLDYAMGQNLDVVWWKVFGGLGREVSLADVRRWNGERQEKDAAGRRAPGDGETAVMVRV